MQIDLETVANGVVVDSRRQPAGSHQRFAIQIGALGDGAQLIGSITGMPAPAAADPEAEFVRAWIQPLLERAQH